MNAAVCLLVPAIAAVLVVGCSSDEDPAPLPSAAPSPTPTTVPYAKDVTGAQDFARMYFARYNESLGTGDTQAVRDLGATNCASCRRLSEIIDRAYAAGGRIDGGRVKVLYVAAPGFTGNEVSVTCIVNQAAGRVLNASGRITSRIAPAVRADDEISLVWTASGWTITDIKRFPS